MLFKNPVRTSKIARHFTITKINALSGNNRCTHWLARIVQKQPKRKQSYRLLKQLVHEVTTDNHMKSKNMLCEENVALQNVKANGKYSCQ
jgi:lipopolysaccharide biosynthesis regulator YciM